MIYKIMLILLFGISFQIKAQNSNKLSDKIDLKNFIKEYLKADVLKENDESSENHIKEVVYKFFSKYSVDINTNDTIFMLETLGSETRIYFGSLWNQQNKIDFLIPYKRKLKFSSHKAFDREEEEAVLRWNKDAFNLFENCKYWINPDWHYATRIVIKDGNIFVERESYLY